MNILVRCDGDSEIGMGHIVRCLALADELQDVYGCHIVFAMRRGSLGIQMVEKKGYQVIKPDAEKIFDYGNWFNECVEKINAKVIIFDARDELSKTVLKELRSRGILIITIDDPEDKRLEADMAFYPPVPQVKKMGWAGFTGELFAGWKWVILRKEFSFASSLESQILDSVLRTPKILVTMGGSDPQGMTIKAIKALEMIEENFEAMVVLGAGFQNRKEIDSLLSNCKHSFDICVNVQNMVRLMSQSDFAIASFGVTAYELAAMKVPAIYLCLTEDHAESASAFTEAGMAVCLGLERMVAKKDIANAVKTALQKFKNSKLRHNINTQLIDGQGIARISDLIIKRFEDKNG